MDLKSEAEAKGPGGMATYFAPPERADTPTVKREANQVLESPLFRAVQETIDGYLMILNRYRQVLAANQRLVLDLGVTDFECFLGKRPGEILSCVHATEGPNGCGTARACSTCGAVLSILSCQEKQCPVNGECLATVHRNSSIESAEFRVRATPVRLDEDIFTVLVLNDISGAKRREALERVFFHDILNTLSGLVGWSHLLEEAGESIDIRDTAQRIAILTQRLNREIRDQQTLLKAESGSLEVCHDLFPVSEIFALLESIFAAHDAAEGKTLVLEKGQAGEMVMTDTSLLVRVLTNMVKNALEASRSGETVRVWFEHEGDRPVFLVHNPAVMPTEVALQVFKRSFSTKGGSGRGIGTYSMKLFGERYLKGTVDFTSEPDAGTTFRIALPPQKPVRG